MDLDLFVYIANFIGVVAFSASGVFKGIKHNLDIFGICVLGTITAVGGGITRDILLNKVPNALNDPHDMYVAIITALIIYLPYLLFRPKVQKLVSKKSFTELTKVLVQISDSIGLAIFAYVGAKIAIDNGLHTIDIVILSTLTGVGGGVIRDILVNETPFILKEDVYAVLCIIGGFIYKYMLIDLKIPDIQTALIMFHVLLIVRVIIIVKNINLPK